MNVLMAYLVWCLIEKLNEIGDSNRQRYDPAYLKKYLLRARMKFEHEITCISIHRCLHML